MPKPIQIIKLFVIAGLCSPLSLTAQIKIDIRGEKLNGNVKKIVYQLYTLWADSSKNRIADETQVYMYYDELKQVIACRYIKNDSLNCIVKDVFKYDQNRLTEHYCIEKDNKTHHFEKDSLYSMVTYTYDGSNRLIEENYFTALFGWKIRYRYDIKGNLIEKEQTDNDSTIKFDERHYLRKIIDKYDNMGYTTQRNTYENDILIYHTIFNYDSDYHYLVIGCDEDQGKTISRYDNRMNLTEEISYNKSDGKFQERNRTRNEYKYDAAGNWVDRINYRDGKEYNYMKRIITYY